MKWFDLIKRVMFVSAICLFGIAAMSLYTQKIPSPGLTGMMSNSGVQEIRITDARYLENVNNHKTAGVLKKRNSLVALNSTDRRIDGAAGYFDEVLRRKLIVGVIVVDSIDSIYLHCTTVDTTVDNGFRGVEYSLTDPIFWRYDMANMGLLRVSNAFSSIVMIGTPDDTGTSISANTVTRKPVGLKRKYVSLNAYHDFTIYKDMLIHSDGRGLPSVFSMRDLDWSADPDTMLYLPRFIPLGVPTPGQVVIDVIDSDGDASLYGRYSYTYVQYARGTGESGTSDTARNSIVVFPKNQVVMLSGFFPRTLDLLDTIRNPNGGEWADSSATRIAVFRKNWDADAGLGQAEDSVGSHKAASNWIQIADFWMRYPDENCRVIDTGQTSDTTLATMNRWSGSAQKFVAMPGQPIWNRVHMPYSDSTCSLQIHFEVADTAVKMAYSFYDPITGLESPLSYTSQLPIFGNQTGIVYTIIHPGDDTSWYPTQFTIGHLNQERCPTDWIRIYRNVLLSGLTGAGDTTVFYCVAQIPVEQSLQGWEGTQIILGMIPDSFFLNSEPIDFKGFDLDYVTRNVSDTYLTYRDTPGDSFPYTSENVAFSEDGELIIRPPFIAPLVIPFTDMEYSNSRLWGIGDPLYPQRLYYSGIDDINDWNPIQYLSLDEGDNDELVAIEKIEGLSGDIMYGLKRNSIYLLSGYDPEYDLTIFRLSDKIGAESRFTVIKDGVVIYFMTPNQRIYSLFNNQLDWISYPIQDYCDTAFNHTDSIRTFLLEDKVVFAFPYGVSDKNNYASYHPFSKSWSIDTYSDSLEPYGSIQYDTLQNTTGFNDDSYWIFERDTLGAYFYYEDDALYDSFPVGGGFGPFHYKPMVYGTPEIGDGENLFQIMSYQATVVATGLQNIIASVRNRAGTELVADTIEANANAYQDYTFTFPTHIGKYLSVRISGNYISQIDDVIIKYRRVGRGKTY